MQQKYQVQIEIKLSVQSIYDAQAAHYKAPTVNSYLSKEASRLRLFRLSHVPPERWRQWKRTSLC